MTRSEKGLQTHSRLITCAMQVMAEQGLVLARTADIAARAGLAHGTVFAHFPSRDELLCAVIEELGSRVARRMHDLAERGGGLADILGAHVQGLIENERLYARLIAECGSIPPRARTTLVMIQSAVSFHLEAAVERETREGLLRPMPLHLLFNTWVGLLHHYLIHADLFAPGEPSVLRRYGESLVHHFHALVSSHQEERRPSSAEERVHCLRDADEQAR